MAELAWLPEDSLVCRDNDLAAAAAAAFSFFVWPDPPPPPPERPGLIMPLGEFNGGDFMPLVFVLMVGPAAPY